MSSIVENFMSKVIIKEWQRLNLCSCLRHNFSCSIFVAKWVPGSKSLVHLVLMVVRDEHSDKETGTSHLRWQKSIEKLGRISPIKPGSFKTGGGGGGWGQICPQAFSFFLEFLEGVTCSKVGSQLSSRKNLQLKAHFWCLGHFVPEIYIAVWRKKVFFLHSGAQRQLWHHSCGTNTMILWPNGKFFDHENFLTYVTYI